MKMHNVFQVFLLELCDQSEEGRAPLPPPIEIDGEEEFEVQEILDSKLQHSKLQRLIKWLGYPDSDNEWVSKEQVASSTDSVKAFHRLYPKKICKGKQGKGG